MNKKRKIIIIIISIFISCLLLLAGSLSYWKWSSTNSQKTSISLSVTPEFSCSADGGGNITSSDVKLVPTTCDNSEYAIKREITTSVSMTDSEFVYLSLWLNVNSIGSPLSSSQNFLYAITTSDESCTDGLVATGSFNGKTANDKVNLLINDKYMETENRTYYLWIWLDEDEIDNTTMNQPFNLSLGGDCYTHAVTSDDLFEITRYTSNYQLISATAVNEKNNITNYAVTTTNSCDSVTWNNIDNPGKAYALEDYAVSSTGDYYVCFKDAEDYVAISPKITVSNIKASGPDCAFGEFSTQSISDGETATISLACTDDIGLSKSEIELSDLTTSTPNVVTVAAINKTKNTGVYNYEITLLGNSSSSSSSNVTISLPTNTIENKVEYGNSLVTSSSLNVTNDNKIKAVFYYNSNSTSGSLTVASKTVTTDCTVGSSCTITIPSEVTSSVGKYNSAYAGVSTSLSSLTSGSLTITANTIYYAYYSSGVTNYYYNSGYTSRTLYRNEFFDSIASISAVLSTSNTGMTNASNVSNIGTGDSVFIGFSKDNNTSVEYTTLEKAANNSSSTIYDVYQITVNYALGSNVTAIGATTGTCSLISPNTTCNVLTPSVTATSSEYNLTIWSDTVGSTAGTESGAAMSVSTNNATYYANAYTDNVEKTPKLLLLANNVAEYIYDENTYTANSAYGSTTITNVYLGNNTTVPIISNNTEKNMVNTVDFTSSFKKYKPSNVIGMFEDYKYMSTMTNTENFNTSNVTNMSNMFKNAGYSATTVNLNLNDWNVSNVKNMSNMFQYAWIRSTSLSIGDLSNWNTSNVTNMSYMFYLTGRYVTTWSIGDISKWDTSNVTNMASMFTFAGEEATTWSIGDISKWNTSNVTNMASMFSGTGENVTTWSIGDISNWNTSNVTNMADMFAWSGKNATTWNIGNLNNWNTSKVTDMSGMFTRIGGNITTFKLNLNNWDTSNVTNMSLMLSSGGENVTTWSIGDISNWNTSKVTDMSSMFAGTGEYATTWSIGDISNWNTSNVTNMAEMFYDTGGLLTTWNLNLSNWDTSKVINMAGMFGSAGARSKTFSIDLSNWNTSNVTNMASMFSRAGMYATTWNIGSLNNWVTSNVTSMGNMFTSTGVNVTTWNIEGLNNWDTSNVTNMVNMFRGAGYRATTFNLNISSWDTSNVTNMAWMFASIGVKSTLFNLNLNNWNTSKVTNMYSMFNFVSRVNKIYVGAEWDTSNVENKGWMFWGTSNLVGGKGTVYSSAYANVTYARIDGYGGAGYFTFGGNSTYTIDVSTNNSSYGTVSGGGSKTSVTNTTVIATPSSGYGLIGWYEDNKLVSSDENYTFTVFSDRNLEARFAEAVSITVNSENTTYGTVSGGGSYSIGRKITITATSNSSYIFTGWYNGDNLVSRSSNYTFTVNETITLTAHFATKGYKVEFVSDESSYGFERINGITSDTTPVTNPKASDGYEMYGSLNKGVNSSYAVMKVTILGYTSFTLYINSYAQSYYDYTIVSALDAASYPTTYSSTTAYITGTSGSNTYNNQKNPNTFNTTNYKTVTFTDIDSGKHYFYVVYRKDSSGASYNDRGYVLIDPNQ